MDPFSAFSFACNLLHAIELGCKVLLGTAERYKSATGLTSQHHELYQTCHTIDDLNLNLGKSLPDLSGPQQLAPSESRLLDASRRCADLSNDFKLLLSRLEISSKGSVVQTLNVTVKAIWLKDKIETLQKALADARDNLTIALLFYIQTFQSTSAKQVHEHITVETSTTRDAVIRAVKSSSKSVSVELQKLANELRGDGRSFDRQTITSTLSDHALRIQEISQRLEAIGLSQEPAVLRPAFVPNSASFAKVFDRLAFSQMFHRFQQVSDAEHETYHWILEPTYRSHQRWACFATWYSSPDTERSPELYWISGKPGSGKSTLVKFLHNRLLSAQYEEDRCESRPLHCAHHFFWSNGNVMQKTLQGFCRSLLFQLLSQNKDIISAVFSSYVDVHLPQDHEQMLQWTNIELCSALRNAVQILATSGKVLLFIDGLDELLGTEEDQRQLVELLLGLSTVPGSKIIISSRPWNVFQDAFSHLPQLQLEDLTYQDICSYVTGKLNAHPRWRGMCRYHPKQTQELVSSITAKATGVFLWIKLIMYSLMEGLRDGDDLPQLEQKIDTAPAELEDYFATILNSIEPSHRKEASMLLQVAMYQETRFDVVSGFSLLEVSFIGHREGFASTTDTNGTDLDFVDLSAIQFRLESALRKLNSRCKGLLECIAGHRSSHQHEYRSASGTSFRSLPVWDARGTEKVSADEDFASRSLKSMLGLRVDLIHRSLRDLLLMPRFQEFLFQHTGGPFDVRDFLCNARIVQARALSKVAEGVTYAADHSSYLLSVASSSPEEVGLINLLPDVITEVARANVQNHPDALYILPSLIFWSTEHSSFLTLAIDFKLVGYVADNMTAEDVRTKQGRPLLDYILRPRFTAFGDTMFRIGCRIPHLDMLRTALGNGSNPNEVYAARGSSIWALFLCFIADLEDDMCMTPHEKGALLEVLEILLEAGADLFLPANFLMVREKYNWLYEFEFYNNEPSTFKQRWGDIPSAGVGNFNGSETTFYAVSSLISTFVISESDEGEMLIAEIQAEENRRLKGDVS